MNSACLQPATTQMKGYQTLARSLFKSFGNETFISTIVVGVDRCTWQSNVQLTGGNKFSSVSVSVHTPVHSGRVLISPHPHQHWASQME